MKVRLQWGLRPEYQGLQNEESTAKQLFLRISLEARRFDAVGSRHGCPDHCAEDQQRGQQRPMYGGHDGRSEQTASDQEAQKMR